MNHIQHSTSHRTVFSSLTPCNGCTTLFPAYIVSVHKIPIFLHLENGMVATGLEIKYVKPPPKVPGKIKPPQITSVLPNHGSSVGGDWIRVYGMDFLNTEDLSCKFGESLVRHVHFISVSEIRCRTPRHLPGTVSFDVINSGSGESQNNGFEFTFVPDLSVLDIHPRFGSINGGTAVHVFGSFPSSLLDGIELNIKCKFGMGRVVTGELVSQNEITCRNFLCLDIINWIPGFHAESQF